MKVTGTLFQIYAALLATALLTGLIVAAFVDRQLETSSADDIELWTTAGFATLAAVLVAVPVAWFLTRRLRQRVRGIRRAAEDIASGQLERRLHDHTRDEIGRLANAFNSMTDQLKDRLSALDVESDKLASILASMVEGLIATDKEERIVHINSSAARILDLKEDEALGKVIWEATRFPQIHEILEEAMRDGGVARTEISRPTMGTDEIIELRASSLIDDRGTVNGAIVVMHDVSHLRRLERMRRDFVSNVSHELKTPLMAIQGLIETMLDDPDMAPDIRVRFLSRLRNQGDRLASLVPDLLELSRVETMPSTGEEQEVLDLRDPVRNSVDHAAPYADEKDIKLTYVESPDPLHVQGDSEMLRQLVDNLLQNALKYTPGEGCVTVTSKREEGDAVLEVRDTGIGIEAKNLPRIFERFYRVDKARSRELGGTGLGLSIVKHVAIAHSGSVDVDSEPGVGSTFRFRVPLTELAMEQRA